MELYARITDPYGHSMYARLIRNENDELVWQRSSDWVSVCKNTTLTIKTKQPFIGKMEKDLFTIFSDQPFDRKEFEEAINEDFNDVIDFN